MSEPKYSQISARESYESSSSPSSASSLEEEISTESLQDYNHPRSRYSRHCFPILLTINLICFLSYIIYYETKLSTHALPHHQSCYPDPPYSPATPILTHTTVKSAQYDEVMSGSPSKEHDAAWLNLVTPALIRSSYEEMVLGGEDPDHSVEMAEGGGYMTSLGVYHELHCLRRLKLYLHRHHYYPHLSMSPSDPENAYELKHLSHCIESIRLSLMCAGNPALYSFQWGNETRKPKTKTNSSRVCVDWERLDSWTRERGVGLQPRLKHDRHKVGQS